MTEAVAKFVQPTSGPPQGISPLREFMFVIVIILLIPTARRECPIFGNLNLFSAHESCSKMHLEWQRNKQRQVGKEDGRTTNFIENATQTELYYNRTRMPFPRL